MGRHTKCCATARPLPPGTPARPSPGRQACLARTAVEISPACDHLHIAPRGLHP